VRVKPEQAVVCVVGERLKEVPGIVCQVFEDLRDTKTSMVSMGGSEINLSFVVDEEALPQVISRLHQRFFSDPTQAAGGAEKEERKND
jgi:aspartate kinase